MKNNIVEPLIQILKKPGLSNFIYVSSEKNRMVSMTAFASTAILP